MMKEPKVEVEIDDLAEVPAVFGGIYLAPSLIRKYYEEGEWGDSLVFKELYLGQVLFDNSERRWYFFEGHSWSKDRTGRIESLVATNVAAQFAHLGTEMIKAGNDRLAEELFKRARALRSRSRIDNVLHLAATQPGIAITGDEWHRNTMLIACPNGVIDLSTGEFRNGQPEDYLRDMVPTEFIGVDTPAPRWEQFLSEIFAGHSGMVDFVQRLLGYGLTGLATDDRFPILWGEGRNGKDTLLETIEFVLSNAVAAPVQSEVLVNTDKNANAATPHLIALRNRRIVWVNETNEGARINAGQVKLLTGGGTIAARPLYGQATEFKPTHLIMLMTNHKPHAGDDDAVWKRLLLIPFTERFLDDPDPNNEHEHKVDTQLSNKLKLEAAGILAWLVRGARKWMESGFNEPPEVYQATQEYRSKEDVLEEFLRDMCILSKVDEVGAMDLYKSYRSWAEDGGLRPMTITAFGDRLSKRFLKVRRSSGVKYTGLYLKTN